MWTSFRSVNKRTRYVNIQLTAFKPMTSTHLNYFYFCMLFSLVWTSLIFHGIAFRMQNSQIHRTTRIPTRRASNIVYVRVFCSEFDKWSSFLLFTRLCKINETKDNWKNNFFFVRKMRKKHLIKFGHGKCFSFHVIYGNWNFV